jgi:hypothetical protein
MALWTTHHQYWITNNWYTQPLQSVCRAFKKQWKGEHQVSTTSFMASHNPALVDEYERLEDLNIETNLWYEQMVENGAIRAA